MAQFSNAEKHLLKSVTDDRLQTSLSLLREAMESIWSPDAPRVIRDYTDHGQKHCERLAGFAKKLLEANDGQPLTEREMYLLLGGIYLHDIGMQCDVVRFPEVKATAEKLGAKFDVDFTAQTASTYSVEEQKAIRRNHQLLSVAWTDEASRNGTGPLNLAGKSVPVDLFDDLMDVCKYHTKYPIGECPIAFKLDPNARKQLVAAVLRFADELDIDANRVNFETVRTFNLDPRNAVHWWLHSRTKVAFTTRSAVRLITWLNVSDSKEFGDIIQDAFIAEFQSKNKSVLDILRQHKIPFTIDAASGVETLDRADPLPEDVKSVLRSIQQTIDPVMEVAGEVRAWLRAVRYEVTDPNKCDGRIADMIATMEQGAVKQRILIRCLTGEINQSDVEELDKLLDRKTPQGWLITDVRVSEAARQRAAADSSLGVFNLSEFLSQQVWGPYFASLAALVQKDRISDLYVDVGCYKETMDEKGEVKAKDGNPSLDKYIDAWLGERGKAHISVLGQFGSGKTWFCRHYACQQLQRYLANPVKERLPLLITLRAFSKAMTAQQLINDALLEQYNLPFVGSAYDVFVEMNRRGKLLLILDGFDEMARQVDYQTVVDNFWELAKLVDPRSKVILTSRSEYFRWAKDSEKILGGQEYGRSTIILEPPKFEVIYIEPLTNAQIRELILKRVGPERAELVTKRILSNARLLDMARKPVLVELLLAALDEVSPEVLENPAQVYLYATNKLLLRNIATRRTFTTTADKLYFLCELAWEMLKTGELRVHYTSIPDRIKTYFGDRIKDQHDLDTWDFDLRGQTLLHRNATGYYEFAHKSLAEFFVAIKLASELGCLNPAFSKAYSEEGGRPCLIPIKPKRVPGLLGTLGAVSFRRPGMQAVLSLLPSMLSRKAPQILWKVIQSTRGQQFESIGYVGGNAATLLARLDNKGLNRNLADLNLTGADLSLCDLREANLERCCFREADLSFSNIQDGALAGTALLDTVILVICSGSRDMLDNNRAPSWLHRLGIPNFNHLSWLKASDGRLVVCCFGSVSPLFRWDQAKKIILSHRGVEHPALYYSEKEQLGSSLPAGTLDSIIESMVKRSRSFDEGLEEGRERYLATRPTDRTVHRPAKGQSGPKPKASRARDAKHQRKL
jgi:hypothetical protein